MLISTLGLGQLVAALLALVVTMANKEVLDGAATLGSCDVACLKTVDSMWRVVLGYVNLLLNCTALF